MPKYRKKPIEVEAIQWNGANETVIRQFVGRYLEKTPTTSCLIIPTLEGDHIASVGDYIIKGVHGEFYPCKPDIFAKTYEDATINPESLRPKGEWLQSEGGVVYCKNCGATVKLGGESALTDAREIEHFCYNCGADMRGTENER